MSKKITEKHRVKILDYFESQTVTLGNILGLAKHLFEIDSFAAGKVLSTRRFKYIVNAILYEMKVLDPLRSQVKNSLYDTIQSYRTKNGSRVNHAPVRCPLKLREAMYNLYYNTRSGKRYSKRFSHDRILRNKITALHALCAFISQRRWIDITRIRWDNMIVIRTNGLVTLKFFIACSKANHGVRNEGITLMEDSSDLCPVRLITEYWINSGKPKFGFVFPCLHKKAKYPEFELCDQWLSKRCKGHKLGPKVFSCNGEINGDVTYRVYLQETKRLGFDGLPSKNTFRRLGCIMAHKLELTRDQITTTMGWKHDSAMPNHYLQDQLSVDKTGLAFKLAEKIRNNDYAFLTDIPMNL